MTVEMWTTSEVQAFLGLGSARAARVQLARWRIEAVCRDVDSGEKLWNVEQVHAARDNRPGRGTRTDLKDDREVAAPEAEEKAPIAPVDLMAALRASIEHARSARRDTRINLKENTVTSYTIQVEASNAAGDICQAIAPSESETVRLAEPGPDHVMAPPPAQLRRLGGSRRSWAQWPHWPRPR